MITYGVRLRRGARFRLHYEHLRLMKGPVAVYPLRSIFNVIARKLNTPVSLCCRWAPSCYAKRGETGTPPPPSPTKPRPPPLHPLPQPAGPQSTHSSLCPCFNFHFLFFFLPFEYLEAVDARKDLIRFVLHTIVYFFGGGAGFHANVSL